MPFASPTLRLTLAQYHAIVAHCYDGLPNEACGLLAGPVEGLSEPVGPVSEVYPCDNSAESARAYTVDSEQHFRAMRDAQTRDEELIGVWHSHTHTDAYPSDTDVNEAREPTWIYVIVSLKQPEPVMRAYRIRDGKILEVDVEVDGL